MYMPLTSLSITFRFFMHQKPDNIITYFCKLKVAFLECVQICFWNFSEKPLAEKFSEPCQLTNMERFAEIVKAKRGQWDSLSASVISCIKLLNIPFSSCLQNSSRTHFFLFLFSFSF